MGVAFNDSIAEAKDLIRSKPEKFQGLTEISEILIKISEIRPSLSTKMFADWRNEIVGMGKDEFSQMLIWFESKLGDTAHPGPLDIKNTVKSVQFPPDTSKEDAIKIALEEEKAEFEREQERISEREESIREAFGRFLPIARKEGEEIVRQAFIGPRQQLAEQEAVLGRLRSPIGAVGEKKLAGEEALALSQLLGEFAKIQAAGEFDIVGLIEGLKKTQRESAQQAKQLGLELGLRRDIFEQSKFESAEERKLAKLLGILSAEKPKGKKVGFLDFLLAATPQTQIQFQPTFGKKKEEEKLV